ncbi:MAG: hypothetical protein E6J22_03345 [Chloroflexi bacterium]|nr:MAG: hypothetical protein E6J22_03345 [Chloroflexota bacterium]
MTHEFDQAESWLAHLEQILERLRQEHERLRVQLAQVTQEEQQALKGRQQSKQQRKELKRRRKELTNELISVMDAQLEIEERLASASRFFEQEKQQAPPGDHS